MSHSYKTSLTLADLIDIECQFAEDSDQDEQELRTRYRQIGQELESSEPGKSLLQRRAGILAQEQDQVRAILRYWIEQLRTLDPSLPGHRVVRTLRSLQVGLFIIGFLLGGAVCKGVLAYDGSTPINVFHFINVFIFFQVVLFIYLIVALSVRSKLLLVSRQHVKSLGPFYESIKSFIYRGKRGEPRDKEGRGSGKVFSAINRVNRYRAPVEQWRMVLLTQLFGVGFNIGATLTFINLVIFTDLAFSWSTTLNMSSQDYEAIVRVIASPWSWLLPEAVPSLFAIEHTQYLRLDQRYVLPFSSEDVGNGGYRFTSADAIKSWWPFLFASLIFYGLLPRLLMAAFAVAKSRYYLKHARFDTPEVARLISWMASPAYTWDSADHLAQGQSQKELPTSVGHHAPSSGSGLNALNARSGNLLVIVLGNMPLEVATVQTNLESKLGIKAAAVLPYEGASVQLENIAAALSGLKGKGALSMLLLAEGFEAPTQEMRSMVAHCLELVPDLWVFVSAVVVSGDQLAPASGDEAAMWEGSVKKMQDPRLMYLAFAARGGEG